MASELIVQTLKGPTSGANANKILLGSGQELYAPGHVIQVVQGTTSTQVNNTSQGTYADTGLTASITPSSTSSKILVLVNQHCTIDRDDTYMNMQFRILRDTTAVQTWGGDSPHLQTLSSKAILHSVMAYSYLDSPSSTSALAYKTQVAPQITSSSGAVRTQFNSRPSYITLMEIAG